MDLKIMISYLSIIWGKMFTLTVTDFGQISTCCSPLMKALVEKDEHNVKQILFLDPSCINDTCDKGWTALHIACWIPELFIFIPLLLEHGADQNLGHMHPLDIICSRLRLRNYKNPTQIIKDTITCLLAYGANINMKDSKGNTLLFLAVMNGASDEFITFLIQSGADPTIKNDMGYDVVENTRKIVKVMKLEKENQKLRDEIDLLRLHPLPGRDFIELYKEEFSNSLDDFVEAYLPVLKTNLVKIHNFAQK